MKSYRRRRSLYELGGQEDFFAFRHPHFLAISIVFTYLKYESSWECRIEGEELGNMDSVQLTERPWALASFVFEIWQAGFSTTWIVGTMEAWDKKWTKIGLGWHTTAEMHVHTADTRRGTRVDGNVSQQNLRAKRCAVAGNIVSLSSRITLI